MTSMGLGEMLEDDFAVTCAETFSHKLMGGCAMPSSVGRSVYKIREVSILILICYPARGVLA